jgi:hypothetical protein
MSTGPSPMSHDRYVENVRREIARIARSMLRGEISFIEGARRISARRLSAELCDDPDIEAFVLIDSETESIPIGDAARRLWAPEALAKLEPDIERSQKWASEVGRQKCLNLVNRFGTGMDGLDGWTGFQDG